MSAHTATISNLKRRKTSMGMMMKEIDGYEELTSIARYLLLSWEFPPNTVGGLSKHVFELSKQFAKLGIEVHVLTTGAKDLQEEETLNGVYIHRVIPLNENDDQFLSWVGGLNLAMAKRAMELAESQSFSVLHAHDWLVGAAALLLKDILKLPLVTTVHATEYGRNAGIHNEMQQFIHGKEGQLVKESEKIIVCSDYMKRELLSLFPVSERKIAVIPNGMDPEITERKGEIMHPPVWKGKKLIFSIGRIVKEKGFETIIEAASLVKKRELPLFFLVAGRGPLLEYYRQMVHEKGLGEQLHFIGYISEEDKKTFMQQSDMNIFPSLYEPFGIVALESMIVGKPTIVSDTGGFKGIIKHKQTGLFMIPGNAESLLEQIIFTVKNPQKAHAIGCQGEKTVRKLYGWSRVAAITKEIIDSLCFTPSVIANHEEEKNNKTNG